MEKHADIVAEMRRRIAVKMSDAWYTQSEWAELCDRLEAAWKRERATCGNAAATREALENAYSLLCEGIATEVDDELEHPFHLELAREKIQNALSAPPRNCDVGTAEEQLKRLGLLCNTDFCGISIDCDKCALTWAQMPYEKGGAA